MISLIILVLGLANGADKKLESFTWQEAYSNAYRSTTPSNTIFETLSTSNNRKDSHGQSLSLMEVSSVLSNSTDRLKPVSSNPEQTHTVMFFDLATCVLSPTDIIDNARDGHSCATNEYSCMSFWQQEVSLQMLTRTWCISNAFETLPTSHQAAVIAPYRKYLHNVVAPTWNYFMLMSSPAHSMSPGSKSGLPTSAAQVQKSKQECEDADTLPAQVQCMTRKIRDVAHLRSNFLEIPASTFKAMQVAHRSQKQGLSLLRSEGLSVLRNSIEDPIPLGYLEINNSPDRATTNPAALFVGLSNPLVSSLNTHGGKASKNRFSSITPGLKMMLVEPTTELIPESRGNDGSPGALYVSEGKTDSFHVYWPGGYFCYDAEMCFNRCRGAPMLCSSKGWEQNSVFSGAFNPNNGGMEGWTHGLLGYTSSDAYLGQTALTEFVMVGGTKVEENPAALGTFFEGLTMGSASLKKFVMMGLGQTPDTTLAISGCSAGAIGLASLTDMLPQLIQGHALSTGVPYFQPNIVVVQDSAPITNGAPPSNGEMSLPDQSQALLYMLYTMQGLDPGLQTTYPSCFGRFGNLCVWSPYVLPYLTVHSMVMHNMWDSFELGESLNSTTYVSGLKLILEEGRVMDRCTKRQNMFGPNCYDHCYTENPWWWRLAPATAKDPYWKWTAKDTFTAAITGDLGHVVRDQLIQFGSGCIGQEYFNSLMGVKQLKKNQIL